MRSLLKILMTVVAATLAVPTWAQSPVADDELTPEMVAWLDDLSPRSGRVKIDAANAQLDLGDAYVFYGEDDAWKILTEAWGNPPETAEGVLGLVMPKWSTPFSDSWGAVITFEEVGYVSDDDAANVDYDELLEELQEATDENNEARIDAGFESIKLVGWATRPVYDSKSHSVVWAEDLVFSSSPGEHALNYDLRTLGRYGVLSMNLVSTMKDLPTVQIAANALAKRASFTAGARYEDFDPATDEEAGFGIGGLIAAGAGVAAAKKLGIFALLLKFLKPLLVVIVVAFGVFRKRVMALFGRQQGDEYVGTAEPSGGTKRRLRTPETLAAGSAEDPPAR
ncbi:DUF2167 domain-containing protein [Erythrobacter mangrovi]|uniref:DUF2167 domain-containing protein n=1 Tax=Erythrobacter mangrovi TaxID=2739433 RepID=A0A7D4CMT4_9SPHN|nr:DUF2167 domain-containing protein [Erythrobacter mangrovi]QKG71528.1 DUF2167 domain-containing protein [Erythrobacter mangrovi]